MHKKEKLINLLIYDLIKKKELKSAINVKLNIIAMHICITHSHLTLIIQKKKI